MNIKHKVLVGLILAAAAAFGPADFAGAQIDFGPSQNNASGELFTRVANGKVQAVIRIKIDEGWHFYDADKGHPKAIGMEARITMGPESVKWSRVLFPKPHRLPQPK